ncbi:hypothetical protein LOK49_LG08G02836 [Camellia lanceoleosa]|uniref:Uncharacterized protein n=1 Tax=Camellia lanceoleosa TaxID=1840588 RepID=A0ACC0GT76_9ERIC|nr:hypothetical protein LOK49_LG08G02836 [Camellia lanceoleosa]
MFSLRKEVGPRRRLLFLGGRSFEFEESNTVAGKCGLSIVERGEGLRRAVVLNGSEIRWLVARMRLASKESDSLKFWGRLSGGNRSTAVWVRGEAGGGTSFQIVVTTGQRREQVYIPVSAFGDGWEGVALVVDGFGLCVVNAFRPIGSGKVASSSAAACEPARIAHSEGCGGITVATAMDGGRLGEVVYRFLGDRCGGFIEADESSVDLGCIRLRVRSSEATPSRVSFRWGMWQFSLPVLVEAEPVVERWTAVTVIDGDFAANTEGLDSGQLGEIYQPKMGVIEYLNRFRQGRRSMGDPEIFTQRTGLELGHQRGPTNRNLGWRRAQDFHYGEVAQRRWAVVNHKESHLGAQMVNHSSPQEGGPLSTNGDSHVWPSLLNSDAGQTEGGLGCRVSCDPDRRESGRMESSGFKLVVHRAPSAAGFRSRLEEASASGTSQMVDSQLAVRQSQVDLVRPRNASSAEDSDLRLEEASEIAPLVESTSVDRQSQLEIEIPCGTLSVGDPLLEMSRDVSGAASGHQGHDCVVQSPILELQPLAVQVSEFATGFKPKQCFEDIGGFSGEAVPSAEAVSQWVLDRISEVSRCLGLSFEGHEAEAMSLFAAVEASWTQGIPNPSVSRSLVTPSKGGLCLGAAFHCCYEQLQHFGLMNAGEMQGMLLIGAAS